MLSPSTHHSLRTSESLGSTRPAAASPGAVLPAGSHQPPSLCRGAPLAGAGSAPESRSCHPGCTGTPQCLRSRTPPFWQASPHTRVQEKREFDCQAPGSVILPSASNPTHFRFLLSAFWNTQKLVTGLNIVQSKARGTGVVIPGLFHLKFTEGRV